MLSGETFITSEVVSSGTFLAYFGIQGTLMTLFKTQFQLSHF